MEQTVLDAGWDGEWYLRAYDHYKAQGRFQRMRRRKNLHRATGLLRSLPRSVLKDRLLLRKPWNR